MALPLPHVDGVEHRFARVAGVRLHVAEAGAGEPLVLLHGWPQHWYMWRRLVPALAERYRLVMPDLRGFGWSDAPAGDYRKERLAADVRALLDVLGLDRVRLMGHDWGALTGYLLALHHPERVERFVPLNMIHPWPRVGPGALADLRRPAHVYVLSTPVLGERLLRHRPDFVRSLVRLGARRRDAWTRAELDLYAEPLRTPARAQATVALYRTFLLREAVAMAAGRYSGLRLRPPTLLVFGTGDPAISTRAIGGYEPHADDMRVELVPGVGHFIAEEAPETVLEHALPFLAGQG